MELTHAIQGSLRILRRQYFQIVDLEKLKWPDANILKTAEVQTWIYKNLFDQDTITSRPPERYQFRFLKKLVSIIEDAIDDPEEDEISDDLMSLLSSLLSSNLPPESVSAQQKAFVTYTYSTRPNEGSTSSRELPVILLESRAVISSSGTTGLRTWEAALHLGNFLMSESGHEIIRGKNVLELGAGTGLLSILCAKYLEAGRVIATDGDEAVVDAIKTNIFINELDIPESSIESAALKWGWPLEATAFEEDYGVGALDVVLGADVTYDKSSIPLLVSSLRELFDLRSSLQVVIAASIRNEKTFEVFINACSRNHFGMEDINFPTMPEELQHGPFYPTATPIRILRITRSEGPRDLFLF